MERRDISSMESLSLFCHFAGLFSVFIGLVLGFMNILNGDMKNIPMAIYIFFSGYANVKISSKLSDITNQERR